MSGCPRLRCLLLLPALGLLSACSPLTLMSAVSPSAHYEVVSDIRYGEGPRRRVDVYRPVETQAAAPLVVYFYGGGWDGGDKHKFEFVAASLTRAGIVVAIPDYRLFPEVRFPDFVDDGALALAWAVDNAMRFGANPGKVFVMGHSAGAHIAALLALDSSYLARHGKHPRQLAGLIGLSGPYDFLPIESGYLLDVFPEASRARSQPINFVSSAAPPTLLIHGRDDDVVEAGNSERLAAGLRAHNVPVDLEIYADMGHARIVVALAPPLDFVAATLDDCIAFITATAEQGD